MPHLFSSLSSCFCLPSSQSSPQSCTSVSFSSLLFLSLLLDPSRRLSTDRNCLPSALREGKVLLGLSYQNPASNSVLRCGEVLFFRERFLDERESVALLPACVLFTQCVNDTCNTSWWANNNHAAVNHCGLTLPTNSFLWGGVCFCLRVKYLQNQPEDI